MQPNQIIHGDCVGGLGGMDDGCVDLTVFSPPYDALRDYKGYSFDMHELGRALYRVTKDGGLVVMI